MRIHAFASGKVQGVWFRQFVKDTADSIGLSGWIRNLPDGRVECLAEGDNDDIGKFLELLKKGSPDSNVEKIDCEEIAGKSFFTILR